MIEVETARFTVGVFQDVAWATKGLQALAAAGFPPDSLTVLAKETPEAGALNVKLSNRGSTIASVAPAAGAPTLTSVKLVNYDRQWATDNKTRILQKWQDATK